MSSLQEYIDNPESVPNDPDQVQAILEKLSAPEPESGNNPPEDRSVDSQPDEASAQGAQETPKDAEDAPSEAGKVIKAKDGKHELPYSVLENERRRSRELQQQLMDAQERLQSMEAAATNGSSATKETVPADMGVADDLDAAIARIEEEYGEDHELARPLRVQQQKLRAMEARMAKLDEIEAWRNEQESKARNSVLSELDSAIDSIPILAKWRDENGPLWVAAVAVDDQFKKDPAYADKSMQDRFRNVVKALGHDPQTQNTHLETIVDEKLAAQERRRAPTSLSDMPGGAAFAQSERDSLETMSVVDIASKYEKMTPEQREAFLAGL